VTKRKRAEIALAIAVGDMQTANQELVEAHAEADRRSRTDMLTGAFNRRHFTGLLESLLTQDQAPAGQLAVLLVDIDHFKSINDRLGHAAGDEVLVEVAQRLRACVDARGRVLRWGGEEFLVHVDGGDTAGHADLVRGLLCAIAAAPVRMADGQDVAVTITAGALVVPPGADTVVDWQHALALADEALYRGKQEGRRCAYLVETDAAGSATRSTRVAPDCG
jgi:diguanylate cyclase (GGDEF)-like protein